jgi:SM-20-related protein
VTSAPLAMLSPPTVPFVIFDEFLDVEEWQALMRYAFERQGDFDASRVVGSGVRHHVDQDYRRSHVLFDLSGFRDLFAARISAFLPYVFHGLWQPPFAIRDIAVQLTATQDGEFFATHNDNGADSLQGRAITFVYFFHSEPRGFGGGDLRLYETSDDMGGAYPASCVEIVPQQNQICFFPSERLHEVCPVRCPSGQFMDSRFTVNGWLHR